MDATAYHLQAQAPFHFGLRGVGIEATAVHARSDTVFSALCHAMRQQFGPETLEAFLDAYDGPEPPLILASAFPYARVRREEDVEAWRPSEPFQLEDAVRFFPRPLGPPPGVDADPGERKRVKKIRWVSEGIFRAWVGGKSLQADYHQQHVVQGGRAWLTAEERGQVAGWRDEETETVRLWSVGDVPRVTVDRQANLSAVYQAGRVWFQPGGGLWMLMRWREDWKARGELALQVLGHAGIGGERSAGHGQFDVHGPHTMDRLPEPAPGGHFVTLSLYYPRETESPEVVESDAANYRLEMRRGWMSSPDDGIGADGWRYRGRALRRKAVRMLAAGSILRWPDGSAAPGALADVTPDAFRSAHPVYRYGYAYAVGYRQEGGGA